MSKYFAHFSWVVYSYLPEFFIFSGYESLIIIVFWKCFPPVCALSTHSLLLNSAFQRAEFLVLTKLFVIFSFVVYHFCVPAKIFLSYPWLQRHFFSIFSARCFTLLGFACESIFHFELIFVFDARYGSRSIPLLWMPKFQHNLLKNDPFSIAFPWFLSFWKLWMKLSCMCTYFGSCFFPLVWILPFHQCTHSWFL